MSDGPPSTHDEIIELLPDYAVGALDDGDLWRVAAHLDTCGVCQRELSEILGTIVLLADAPLPRPVIRRSVIARTKGDDSLDPRDMGVRSTPPSNLRRFSVSAVVPLALAVAVLLLVAGYAVWSVVLDDDETEADFLAALVLDPDKAHPINDSELDVGAGGAMFVDDERDIALLIASGLPVPASDERYQVWLFKENGERVAAGFVPVDPDGVGQVVVRAPEAFAAYWAVGVSLEPASGSDAPTTPLVVGGWLR